MGEGVNAGEIQLNIVGGSTLKAKTKVSGSNTNLNFTKKFVGPDKNLVVLPVAPEDKQATKKIIIGNPKEQGRVLKEIQLRMSNLEK